MATKSGAHKKSTLIQFFQKQLKGDEPLSVATAQRLYDLSVAFAALAPWSFIGDGDLVLVKDPYTRQIGYCSIMGALGEVFSLHVYIGEESYRGLRKILAGEQFLPGEFFATHRGVSLEFVRISEAGGPDRELLKHFQHPMGRGAVAPIFRSLRPGYHPWHISEPEAVILARCVQAVLAFCSPVMGDPDPPFWKKEDVYPLLVPVDDDGPQQGFTVQLMKVTDPPVEPPIAPVVDEARLGRILAGDHSLRGVLEVDHFYSGTVIGDHNERKAILPVALVTDAESGFLFPPELGTPWQSRGEVLAEAVLKAIEGGKHLPREIRVNNAGFKTLLDSLAQRLGADVKVVKRLSGIERAKKSLLTMMQGG